MVEDRLHEKGTSYDPFAGALDAAGATRGDLSSLVHGVIEALDSKSKSPSILLRDASSMGPDPVLKPIQGDAADFPRLAGKYQIFGEIAHGGIGMILKGHDSELGRDVAVKVLQEKHGSDAHLLQRFIEEAQIGGQLQHPGIVPVYEIGSVNRRPFFTMKLVKGRTLAALLAARRDARDDQPRFLGIFEQVCQTMAYAHSRGVIHRDLKPSNVMVGAFGEVQVVDWGLAKVLPHGGVADEKLAAQGASGQTAVATVRSMSPGSGSMAGSVMGTPAYMPPEQATGDVECMDERSDVFSLGAMLCEVLTGLAPYAGFGVEEAIQRAARGQQEAARQRLEACGADPELVDLVKECLTPAPQERPRSAEVLAMRVSSHLAAVESRAQEARVAAAEARVKAQAARKAQRLTSALAAAMVGILLLGGGSYFWFEKDRAARSKEASRAAYEALSEAESLRSKADSTADEDPGSWAVALQSAQQARRAADSPLVAEDVRDRARRLVDGVVAEEKAARERVRQARADRETAAELERIPVPRGNGFEFPDVRKRARILDEDYSRTFRGYGIDVRSLEARSAAASIKQSSIAAALVEGLDEWALALFTLEDRDGLARLRAISREADTDPERAKLRDALFADETLGSSRVGKDVVEVPRVLKEILADVKVDLLPAQLAFFVGRVLPRFGDLDGAIRVLKSAQCRFPGDFNLAMYLAYVFTLRSPPLWTEAARFYTAAHSLRPQNVDILISLGVAMHGAGDLDGAEKIFRQVIETAPGNAFGYYNLGVILRRKGRLDEAIEALRATLRLDSTLTAAHNNLAGYCAEKGDFDAAVIEAEQAVHLEPENASFLGMLAIALQGKGSFAAAANACSEALRFEPNNVQLRILLGKALCGQGRHEDAAGEFAAATRAGALFIQAWESLAGELQSLGHFRQALDAALKVHELRVKETGAESPFDRWALRQAQILADHEVDVPHILRGERDPDSGEEAVAIARFASGERDLSASARLYAKAFALAPELAEDMVLRHRFNAAVASSLAASTSARFDAVGPGAEERTAWALQACDWLLADLTALRKEAAAGRKADVLDALGVILGDPDLAALRESAVSAFPEVVRDRCRRLWKDSDDLRRLLEEKG